jgi:hypothetical protein
MTHLRFDMWTKPDGHPQKIMKELGITYKYGIPQSLGDQWWFWDCENVPEQLPEYLKPMEVSKEMWEHWTK